MAEYYEARMEAMGDYISENLDEYLVDVDEIELLAEREHSNQTTIKIIEIAIGDFKNNRDQKKILSEKQKTHIKELIAQLTEFTL